MKSPLTHNSNVQKIKAISTKYIIEKYKELFAIDVAEYFEDLDQISIYKCLDTGYQFYYPFSIAGRSAFYEQLQEIDWYYMNWKWEHDETLKHIEKSDSILEIGSGGNGFIEKLSKDGYNVTGLEINEKSIAYAKENKLKIVPEFIEDHAITNSESYDVVCSFQVLEHISNVNSFLEGAVKCIKPGGKLIICVPNNESFIKDSPDYMLNMPPHHMGLWSESSLKSLSNLFQISTDSVIFEPLQQYHHQWYQSTMENKYLNNDFVKKLYYKLRLNTVTSKLIEPNLKNAIGHSIMGIYTKK